MSSPLVVPIDVEALVVNAAYIGAQGLRRWGFNYTALSSYDSPEPEALAGQQSTQPPATGVHVRWTLPTALRHGRPTAVGASAGAVEYPHVPNRWLIVRLAGEIQRQATAWVLESDCPNAASPTQYLVDADILTAWTNSGDSIRAAGAQSVLNSAQGGPPVATLGLSFPAATWHERSADTAFLTAVAPGNALFTAYQPHHDNVFAFTDPAADVTQHDKLSYLVVGWHSSPADDPLITADVASALTTLGWAIAGDGTPADVSGTLYEGFALAVDWNPTNNQAPPTPITALTGKVGAAVGMTDLDALTAIVAAQPDPSGSNPDPELLQAFQYGLLPVFEQVNGAELLGNAVHQAGFASVPGGTRWTIAPAQGDDPTAPVTLTADETTWLAQLNAVQDQLDAAELQLARTRTALYGVWWKRQKANAMAVIAPPDGFDDDAYAAAEATLTAAASAAAAAVESLQAQVPQPDWTGGGTRQDAYARGVASFASGKLADGHVLKAAPGPRYWRSSDPTVLLSGVSAGPPPDPGATLECRLATVALDELVVGTTTVTAAQLGAVVPTTGLGGAPAACAALLTETFLLDARSSNAIAQAANLDPNAVYAAITGQDYGSGATVPALGTAPWTQQPWTPLLMEWQISYLPIPWTPGTDGGSSPWAFDGHDYVFTGGYGPFDSDQTAKGLRQIGGISLLTPQTQLAFRARLEQFVTTYAATTPGADPAQVPETLALLGDLDKEIAGVNQWEFVTQTLTGFGDLVALRDTRAQTAPDGAVGTTVAGQTGVVPYIPDDGDPAFSALRAGQFAFTTLIVYDAWGQVLQVVGGSGVTDPDTFVPTLDPGLKPEQPVITRNPQRLIEVRPRVMQPGRLDFLLVDATDDTRVVGTSPGANPIGGWLLPNHLDRSLMLYAPDGTDLGALRVLADDQGGSSARWQAPAHSAITAADVRTLAPRIGALVDEPALADPATFLAFLDTIDATLWTIDPLGNRADVNLSVLIGRPLALVRAKLDLELDGPAIADQSAWSVSWPPPASDVLSYEFPVRLGDLATRSDGLIGYFLGDATATFNTVPAPAEPAAFLQQIGPPGVPTGKTNYINLGFGDTAGQAVTMLVDPRASVNAMTGILPVKTLTIPPVFVDGPLAALEVAFTADALLTTIVPTSGPSPANPEAVTTPQPIEQGGTWAWWERSTAASSGWASYDLARATPDAALTDQPTTVRDGVLQLTVDLASPPSNPSE